MILYAFGNTLLLVWAPFQFGLVSPITGRVNQIDTSDLIWSPLFLTLGIVGTILYILVFFQLLRYFYRQIENSPYAICAFLTILTAIFTSLTGAEMLTNSFRTIILLLLAIVIKANLFGGRQAIARGENNIMSTTNVR